MPPSVDKVVEGSINTTQTIYQDNPMKITIEDPVKLEESVKKEITLQWDISLHAKVQKKTVPILEDVRGELRGGMLTALMGASGAGKSSLLDCISLRNQKFTGQILFNGKPVDKHYFGSTAYVYQDDLFFPTLTVREHLTFHAHARMGADVTEEAKLARVDEVIRDVGLQACQDSLIGGSNGLVRGVSGGERKRVSVATELLSDPAVLFLDEPTTGLDSYTSEMLCLLLRRIANEGRIVVCVIHQPSSETFDLFTHLCLMAKGRMAYLGELRGAAEYFARIGYPCPGHFNPADFYIEILAVVPSEYEESVRNLRLITDQYASSDNKRKNDVWAEQYPEEFFVKKKRKKQQIAITDYHSTHWTQFRESCKRTFLQYKREPVLTRARLSNAIFIGLILGIVYMGQDDTFSSVQNKLGVGFIITMNQVISSCFGVVQEVPKEFCVFMREHLAGANRVSSYFIARTISEIPFQVLFPTVFSSIVYWMVGMRPELNAFLIFLCIVILCANTAVSLGYAISAVCRNAKASIAAAPVLITPMALFAGLLLDSSMIPIYFKPFAWISVIKYAYHAIMINEYGGQIIYCDTGLICLFRDGDSVLGYIGADPTKLMYNIGMLALLLVLFRAIAFFALIRASGKSSNL